MPAAAVAAAAAGRGRRRAGGCGRGQARASATSGWRRRTSRAPCSPTRPSAPVSPICAMPTTSVANTSGAMIILISRRKIVVTMPELAGDRLQRRVGRSGRRRVSTIEALITQPTTRPSTSPIRMKVVSRFAKVALPFDRATGKGIVAAGSSTLSLRRMPDPRFSPGRRALARRRCRSCRSPPPPRPRRRARPVHAQRHDQRRRADRRGGTARGGSTARRR